MKFSHFPSLLRGMTSAERRAYFALPWELSNTIPNLPGMVFFGVEGILRDGLRFIPLYQLSGHLPFLQNPDCKYEGHGVFAVISTAELADFLLRHPALLRSYLVLADNANHVIIDSWKQNCGIRAVVSETVTPETISFARALAYFFTGKKQKTLIAEVCSSGQSIFDLVPEFTGDKLPPAISLISENEISGDIRHLINQRLRKLPESPDLLNINFLSPYTLENHDWQALLPALCNQYDEIILHLGTSIPEYLSGQIDSLFYLHENHVLSAKTTFIPNTAFAHSVFTGKSKDAQNSYPSQKPLQKMTEYIERSYGEWLGNKPLHYYADSFGEAESFYPHYRDTLSGACVFEGFSSWYASLINNSAEADEHTSNLLKKAQPHFPDKGFYRESFLSDFISDFLGSKNLSEKIHVILSNLETSDMFVAGMAPAGEKIISALFKPGIIEGNWQSQAMYAMGRKPAQCALDITAYMARKKFSQMNYIRFLTKQTRQSALQNTIVSGLDNSPQQSGKWLKESWLPLPHKENQV